MENKKIRWSQTALKQFESAIRFIANDSLQNAGNVKSEILEKTLKLGLHPEIHSPDKYKINNDGSFRAFEIHHYRIAYRVLENEIRILRIRHTSREPKAY